MRKTLIALAFPILVLALPVSAPAQDAAAAQKYMLTWHERPGGSYEAYEAAQERILGLFKDFQIPDSIAVQSFVVRVGEYGGFMMIETNDLQSVHEFTSIFSMFSFDVEPVLDVMDAVSAEVKAIGYRHQVDSDG